MTATARADLIDIGANLGHDSFDADRYQVLLRAREAGVVQQILTGTTVDASAKALELARQHPGELFSTAGLHPHHAGDFNADALARFRALTKHEEVVAVGECGLDYFRNFSSHDDQHRAFHGQLELACDVQLPAFLHQRDAHEDFTAIVREYRDRLPAAVAHCFTGSRQQLRDYLDLDLHIGITGWICDERRGADVQDAVRYVPGDRLMIETDAPYLLPRTIRPRPKSRRNEPAYLPYILATVAGLRDEPLEQLAAETSATARAFFALPDATATPVQA